MAALSALAEYDVSDVESDDENLKASNKDLELEKNVSDKESPTNSGASGDSPDQAKKEEEGASDKDDTIDDESDNGDAESGFENDDEDESVMISEDEKDISETAKLDQAVKIKFKRYSCDSATALAVKLKGMSQDELHLPPEPEGRCSIQLQSKIKRLFEKKIKEGENLNKAIQSRKDFRNPSIYDKLILFLRIEERGTNFAKADFDPSSWRKVPDYEALARAQREDVAKKEREKKTKVEFVTGTIKKPSSITTSAAEPSIKKSKWDNPGDDKSGSSLSKPTLISAVGPVKKAKS